MKGTIVLQEDEIVIPVTNVRLMKNRFVVEGAIEMPYDYNVHNPQIIRVHGEDGTLIVGGRTDLQLSTYDLRRKDLLHVALWLNVHEVNGEPFPQPLAGG